MPVSRSLPDAREIIEDLARRNVKLSIGGTVHDPTDPVGRLLYNVLAMVAEFESDLIPASVWQATSAPVHCSAASGLL